MKEQGDRQQVARADQESLWADEKRTEFAI